MIEKFRLVIPPNVNSNMYVLIKRYLHLSGKELSESEAECIREDGGGTWLERIKEEPQTVYEWFKDTYPNTQKREGFLIHLLKECQEWTLKQERKKHEHKTAADHQFAEDRCGKKWLEWNSYRLGWRGCDKDRGYDEN